MKGQNFLIAALAFAFVIAWFAVINVDSVQVNFMFTKTQIPLILVILASTLFGGLIVGSFGIIRQFRLQRTVRSLEKRLAELAPPSEDGIAGAAAHPVSEKETEAPASKSSTQATGSAE
ncbi:LapA family protein [Paenibacillus radicis (ex Gao et al. 2016)]|uniref:Lipopolysaccharide assembly protein A domain-containing protein n=1 Tax=Paenibacillus radicis (ex Gao et al. 2016) TaxID=1737354 RepID=A0A917M7I5_9BACL|nr:lipopolysaccharide assembly protein LapA domain-containing protein [Paenibacillus radicis (ex Gao et al. 2016)]GGG82536.1 hypothetical protein GCM10010918_44930 [Paenibacillus radicis (ex Gao et al. 2016)]